MLYVYRSVIAIGHTAGLTIHKDDNIDTIVQYGWVITLYFRMLKTAENLTINNFVVILVQTTELDY